MNTQEVINQVEKYIDQSRTHNIDIEGNKLEFKRKWYDLRTNELYTCVKHMSGIANSLGGGHSFLVFGYDTKAKTLHAATLKDSGYGDSSEIYKVINKKLSNDVAFEVFDFIYNGSSISVVNIHPSVS